MRSRTHENHARQQQVVAVIAAQIILAMARDQRVTFVAGGQTVAAGAGIDGFRPAMAKAQISPGTTRNRRPTRAIEQNVGRGYLQATCNRFDCELIGDSANSDRIRSLR
jgi:hypothetical protein